MPSMTCIKCGKDASYYAEENEPCLGCAARDAEIERMRAEVAERNSFASAEMEHANKWWRRAVAAEGDLAIYKKHAMTTDEAEHQGFMAGKKAAAYLDGLRRAEPVASAWPVPDTKPRQCQWFDEDDYRDPNDLACENVATHTTCDPAGAVVCAEHKCRCSKPLAAPSTATEEQR